MSPNAALSTDRRTQRTRRALRDAFLALMEERGWDGINVQHICERADVGRSTFYMHYRNKEQLLAGGFSDLSALLRGQASPDLPLAFLTGLIEHVDEQKKLFRSLIGRRGGQIVQARFRDMLLKLIEDDLARRMRSGWQRKAAAHYLAGALLECLIWWVESRPVRKAGEVEAYFRRLAEPTLAGLREEG